jgi:hypothetical protein
MTSFIERWIQWGIEKCYFIMFVLLIAFLIISGLCFIMGLCLK